MKQTAVLLYSQFSEYEVSVALSVLAQAGKRIVTIGTAREPIMGEAGLMCLPDAVYEEVRPGDFDSILLPGMMRFLAEDAEMKCVSLLKALADQGCVIGAISLAPYLLAKAGLLNGRPYTVGMYEEDMDRMGIFDKALLVKEAVVEDGNIITAVGVGFVRFGIAFGRALGLSFDETWYG
ncbi:MAG: DJ-1/PfpI family protein [Firmicutes bacterium]|nr:DJ-1/PfpI family protein [Bacillota bacterium]